MASTTTDQILKWLSVILVTLIIVRVLMGFYDGVQFMRWITNSANAAAAKEEAQRAEWKRKQIS